MSRNPGEHRWNLWLEIGKYADIKELAAAEGITSPRYASRILRLVLLAPDVLETILVGRQPVGLTLSQLMEGWGWCGDVKVNY